MKLLTFNFENNFIRTILIENEPFFVLKDIATVLQLKNHKQALSDLKTRLEKISVSLEGVSRTYPLETDGGVQNVTVLSEIGLYELIFASRKNEAICFRYWITSEVLPSIRTTGSYSLDPEANSNSQKEKIELEMLGLETAIKILKVNEASKILMTKTLYSKLGLETLYLPKYSDEQHTYSLSALLKKFEVGISAKKLNQLLISKGFLEVKTRKSTKEFEDEDGKKAKIRTFKSLTEKGLEFGKNLISPHNQLETQPHYFESRFRDMLGVLTIL